MEFEIHVCMEVLTNLSENLSAKFPSISYGYSLAKIDHLSDAFSEVFEQEASPVEGQSLQKIRKGGKGKGKTTKNLKT